MKYFKIKKAIKPEVSQWCLDNLGSKNVRWWFEEELLARSHHDTNHLNAFTLVVDVTEDEESQLMFFILKYIK